MLGEQNRQNRISVKIKTVFIDADAFIALYWERDGHYFEARQISQKIVNLEVFTSYFVLAEAATVISQYTSLKNTSHFLDVVLSSGMTIFELNHSLFLKGKEIFASQTSKNFRFSDACNIALIKEYNLDAVFSFDKHYKQNGILRVGIDG